MPRQNVSHSEHQSAVLREIERLGLNIAIARKRRGETQGQWAGKLGVSQPTMARIERGDPSVAMASYVMCMWLINQADGLADLVAPLQDHAALEREVLRIREGSKWSLGKAGPMRAKVASIPTRKTTAARTTALSRKDAFKPVASKSSAPNPTSRVTASRMPATKAVDSTQAIHERIQASAAKGNATAQGLAALIVTPNARRRRITK